MMLSDKELEQAVAIMLSRLDSVNRLFIRKVAEQIKAIGALNASSIHTLNVMADMGTDVAEVTRALSDATALNIQDLMKLYQRALDDAVADPAFQRYLEARAEREQLAARQAPEPVSVPEPLKAVSPAARDRITRLTQYIAMQTAGNMVNLSNTTAIAEPYRRYVDKAVTAVAAGYQSYDQAQREIIQDLGGNGLQVEYASGYRRRLDVAVRQNIIDGVKQINQQASLAMGEELGFDAVEISAHMMSAPDHEPVQGRVFLKDEYGKMQAGEDFHDVDGRAYQGFPRPIAEWNCGHFATAFSTEYSIRRWSDETLDDWARRNAEGCEIDGKHMTLYQASQYMRALETRARRQKEIAAAAKEAGDMEQRRACQKKIDAITQRYYQVADAAGIRPDPQRMSVEGFRRVKANDNDVAKRENPVIIKENENGRDSTVRTIGKIDAEKYKVVTPDIRTNEVVITGERIQHIKDRHPNDYERYVSYIPEIIANPKYIIEANKPNTAVLLKDFPDQDEKFKLILRLKTDSDPKEYKNSVLSFWKIGDTTWRKIEKNKKILYKSE